MSFLRNLILSFLVLFPMTLNADDFVARLYTSPDGKTLPYRLLIPANYDAHTKYPVILFFHGSGERGTDNKAQLGPGIPDFTKPEDRAKYPAFIIAPQCPPNQGWVDMPWSEQTGNRPAQPSEPMQLALKILDSVNAEFSTDKNRIYAMGLSMGGYATWDCVTRFPDRFAAGVPVCGGGDENSVTATVAQVPVWAFLSSDDPAVPPIRSIHMIEAMIKMGGHPRLYVYSGLGHGSWDKAFSEPELLPWLFAQHLTPPAPPKVSSISDNRARN
jgi:predicted peptidase